jgi:zinc D-Ala-D-Ala carboxypeptidase
MAESAMLLSQHFHIEEFETSQTAARRGIDNRVPEELMPNLVRLAGLLEQVRLVLGSRPIIITSGYRCPALNRAINGALHSAHMDARAADFICPSYGGVSDVCDAIRGSSVVYDQLIDEYGAWAHISVPPVGAQARLQFIRTARRG